MSEYVIIICSILPSSKFPYHMETSQPICKANQLTGFHATGVFTEKKNSKFKNKQNSTNKQQPTLD